MANAKIGVIGGTGLYKMEGMTEVDEVNVKTPFGETNDSIVVGNLEGTRVAFLPRHGKGHSISPTELPVRANIYALKSLGVERIISVNAVGSLREEIKPMDAIIPDQIIDRTINRTSTFFTDGIVGHIAFAEPFCSSLSQVLAEATNEISVRSHKGGIYLAMEGPQFSTKAESNLYRSWGADIIGMTVIPEAKLAREAEICYASLSFVTDYDSWHTDYESVTVEIILDYLHRNTETAKAILRSAISRIPHIRDCPCADALHHAIVTSPALIPQKMKNNLALLIGKYIK
jgi:5'-methylthioadenosine phosphorylase